MPPSELTSDVWALIIDILGHDWLSSADQTLALRNLALTCKTMVPLCRHHLFSFLKLPDEHRLRRFHDLVSKNPTIIQYVREFEHRNGWLPDNDVRLHEIFEILCTSTTLQRITLWGQASWDEFPLRLQLALDKLIHLPTVTTLNISLIQAIPTSIFFGTISITHLGLERVNFVHSSDSSARQTVTSTPRPIYLRADASSFDGLQLLMHFEQGGDASIVDFSRLRQIKFTVNNTEDLDLVNGVLRTSRAVKSLDISTNYQAISWAGLGASLSAGAVETLVKLTLTTFVESEDEDPICRLVSELDTIAGSNNLEEVYLHVIFGKEASNRGDTADDWSEFDALLTRRGSFPRLRLVTVKISWCTYFDVDSDEESDEDSLVNQVTEKNFVKLLDNPDLEFRFSRTYA